MTNDVVCNRGFTSVFLVGFLGTLQRFLRKGGINGCIVCYETSKQKMNLHLCSVDKLLESVASV